MPPKNSVPIIYFNLFFNRAFLQMLKTESNRYARAFFDSTPRISIASRTTGWKKTTVPKLRAFIAVLLEMGITQKGNWKEYWSTDPLLAVPVFSQTMSRNRFEQIWTFWHFNTLSVAPILLYFPLRRQRVST
ncbi:PiggyBac transposable element-derived protein 4 [Anthophora retusa]